MLLLFLLTMARAESFSVARYFTGSDKCDLEALGSVFITAIAGEKCSSPVIKPCRSQGGTDYHVSAEVACVDELPSLEGYVVMYTYASANCTGPPTLITGKRTFHCTMYHTYTCGDEEVRATRYETPDCGSPAGSYETKTAVGRCSAMPGGGSVVTRCQ